MRAVQSNIGLNLVDDPDKQLRGEQLDAAGAKLVEQTAPSRP
jgi:hypothetical protein